jgi:sulfate permease
MVSLLAILAGAASIGLALNIGANNSAAEMGPAYGSGARSRREAVVLIAVFCVLGAVVGGHRVMATVGKNLVGSDVLAGSIHGVLVVVVAALSLVALANILRVPIATSHAVVGSVIGLGLFYRSVNGPLVATVVAWWIVTPLASLFVSYLVGRYIYRYLLHSFGRFRSEQTAQQVLVGLVTVSSCWMAFSAGSNSLAKAMGPAVGAGVFQPTAAAIWGGVAMSLGALLLGGRMIHIVGREITSICPLCAILVQVISASIVFAASRFGMPVSLAEIVTCSVIGFSCAANGFRGTASNSHVRRMLLLWPAAPGAAALIAFGLLSIV